MNSNAITLDDRPVGERALDAMPRLWLLLDDRPGHTTQSIGLAEMLDWPYEAKSLHFNKLNRISNRFLGASCLSLDRSRSDRLEPPWPDLVITTGRRTAPIARWIKRQSGGHSQLVQLGRKAANVADDFDLAVTCAHFQLPDHPKRITLPLPPTQVRPESLEAAAARWSSLFGDAARPRIALLVGGTTAHHRLTPETAEGMAREVQRFAQSLDGSLTCVTSRRSGAAVEQALSRGAPEADLHFWRREQQENPYLGYLAQADILVVTGESESMLAEAASAEKPLYIYPIPLKPPSLRERGAAAVLSLSRGEGPLARLCAAMIQSGLVVPPRDLALMHQRMIEIGVAMPFGDMRRPSGQLPRPNFGDLVNHIHLLLERSHP